MLSDEEYKNLKRVLALAPRPEAAFDPVELEGFLFGLAMTPDIIIPSEWLPVIFGGSLPTLIDQHTLDQQLGPLVRLHHRLSGAFQDRALACPFTAAPVTTAEQQKVCAWTHGLAEALTLREELWDPAFQPQLERHYAEELYDHLLIIEALENTEARKEYAALLPARQRRALLIKEIKPTRSNRDPVVLELLARLPVAVAGLLRHAYRLTRRTRRENRLPATAQATSVQGGGRIIRAEFGRSGNKPDPQG